MRLLQSQFFAVTIAGAAIAAEIALGLQARLPVTTLVPLAIATGGGVIWSLLALNSLILREGKRNRAEIDDLLARESDSEAALAALDRRLTWTERRIRLLTVEPEIAIAERKLTRAADRIEAWDDLAASLPQWVMAVDLWSSLLSRLDANCVPTSSPPTDGEIRLARQQLPATINLSSEDLKIAIEYFVQRDRVLSSHDRLTAYRLGLASG